MLLLDVLSCKHELRMKSRFTTVCAFSSWQHNCYNESSRISV